MVLLAHLDVVNVIFQATGPSSLGDMLSQGSRRSVHMNATFKRLSKFIQQIHYNVDIYAVAYDDVNCDKDRDGKNKDTIYVHAYR